MPRKSQNVTHSWAQQAATLAQVNIEGPEFSLRHVVQSRISMPRWDGEALAVRQSEQGSSRHLFLPQPMPTTRVAQGCSVLTRRQNAPGLDLLLPCAAHGNLKEAELCWDRMRLSATAQTLGLSHIPSVQSLRLAAHSAGAWL